MVLFLLPQISFLPTSTLAPEQQSTAFKINLCLLYVYKLSVKIPCSQNPLLKMITQQYGHKYLPLHDCCEVQSAGYF